MNREYAYHLTIVAVLVLAALLAAAFGFISADSWEYLQLAQAIRHGEGCSVRGSYFAALPCGYPLLIAVTAPFADIGSLLVSSKLTNLLLIAGAYFFATRTYHNTLVPTLIVLNPVTMAIYQYTWSENLFLFAVCASLYAIARVGRTPRGRRYLLLLGVFLLIGCVARYFFAPFAAAVFVGVWLVYGRGKALNVLPAFIVAAAFFLAYQWINSKLTGYGSGMQRLAAPESIAYLLLRFGNSLAHICAHFAVAPFVLLALAWQCWRFSGTADGPGEQKRACVLLAWTGATFLLLAFALRALTHFDMYDTRTIGYGVVFIGAAGVGLFVRVDASRLPRLAAVCCGVLSIAVGNGGLLPQQIKEAFAGNYRSPLAALRDYRAPETNADTVVELAIPDVSASIAANSSLYYRSGTRIVRFAAAPFRKAESLDQFRARALNAETGACAIDFNRLRSAGDIAAYVGSTYVVDLSFDSGKLVPTVRPRLDPSVAAYLLRRFSPGSYVECDEIPSS